MRALVTGSEGFIGRNLCVRLRERAGTEIIPVHRGTSDEALREGVGRCDFVFHLAGVNRPQDPAEFMAGNRDFTARLAALVAARGGGVPVIVSSSTQAERDNPYGQSKRAGEDALLSAIPDAPDSVHVFRLPNVFGKWSRPNYNSAVATFCHNIARGLPINIHDPASPVSLVYVDDVIDAFLRILDAHVKGERMPGGPQRTVEPVYATTVGEMAGHIRRFHDTRRQLGIDPVGTGFLRALYATYLSFLPKEDFAYPITRHVDPRGAFAEMLRTRDSGQFSFFTAHPGITRGGHYHHTKNEKFLVVSGKARFGFRHVVTGETFSLETTGEAPQVVDTVPGWAHDITNIGETELVVLLWANELFDRERPDTITHKV
jgi:UDP-2-acetamido-2,6-beta-L-arabino-hexul-4-ose reductase